MWGYVVLGTERKILLSFMKFLGMNTGNVDWLVLPLERTNW